MCTFIWILEVCVVVVLIIDFHILDISNIFIYIYIYMYVYIYIILYIYMLVYMDTYRCMLQVLDKGLPKN